MNRKFLSAALSVLFVAGCGGGSTEPSGGGQIASAPKPVPAPSGTQVVPVYYSEYPSWGAFAAASDLGLIDGRPGWLGTLEQKHGVDLELLLRPYDTCLAEYGSNGGAVCITNTDIVGIVKGRQSSAILPTSTSFGADAITVIGVKSLDELKKIPVYGLEKSVSDFAFTRIIEQSGQNPKDFQFSNRDPEAGAQALQATRIQAAMLWNPFILQTLKTQPKSSVLLDTTVIPDEVIDMVVMDKATLDKPHGPKAAQCIVDTYYAVCGLLRDAKTSEDAYTSLKDKFAPNLTTAEMRSICQLGEGGEKGHKTKFYDTPASGAAVFEKGHLEPIMAKVTKWAKDRQTIEGDLPIAYDKEETNASLRFDPTFIRASGK